MASIVSCGALRFGQWPVAAIRTSTEPSIRSCTYSPTASGAITSSLHWSTSVGTATVARSARLSDMNVTRAKRAAISGSVRQKLAVSSSPSSGRSGLPMIAGAITLDQPRKLLSIETSSSSMSSTPNPPTYPSSSM